MVCIAVLLILWIGIVWLQDKRTVAMIESQNPDNEEKLEDIGMQDITIPTKE